MATNTFSSYLLASVELGLLDHGHYTREQAGRYEDIELVCGAVVPASFLHEVSTTTPVYLGRGDAK